MGYENVMNIGLTRLKQTETIYNFMRLAHIVVFKLYVDTKKYTCHHPQVLNIGVKNAGVMLYLTPWQN
jgi:hypothetical protein